MSVYKREEIPDGWVEVPTEPSVPEGWKKKVYRMNGRPNPKWVQYYDTEGNRYNTLQSVEARKQQLLQAAPGGAVANLAHKSASESRDLNPKPVKSTKSILSSCDICNIELNSVEELQTHIKQNHAVEEDESGKYFSDDDTSLVEDTSPDDPNLKCIECNTQYKKPNQFENHMKKRHGGLTVNKPSILEKVEKKEPAMQQVDEDMIDYEEEEELEDEFLDNIAPQSIGNYHPGQSNTALDMKPPMQSSGSWYATVSQILQRFRLQDYHIPSNMSNLTEHKDEAKFVHYLTPLLRSVNLRSKTATLHILAKAKWVEVMRGQGVTPVNGSLTNLRKPRKIVVNTL